MDLTEQESRFVATRERLVRLWPMVGLAMLLVVLGFAVWMWLTRPLMINPFAVFERLRAESIPDSTLTVMAAMLPVMMLTCVFLLVVGLVLLFTTFANEKQHLAIIRRLGDDARS